MRGLPRLIPLTVPLLALLSAALVLDAAGPPQHSAKTARKDVSLERSQMLWDRGFELPPGSHLRFAKVDDAAGPGPHTLRYRIYADAAEMGTPYVLAAWHVGTDIDDLEVLSENAYVNRRGLLLANPPNPGQRDADALNDGSELDVAFKAAKGEPVRFILHSQDWKTMIGGTLVPYPIAAASRTCKLSALLADPDGQSLLIYLDGFPPDADVTLNNGAQQRPVHTDAHGQASAVETPGASGASAGTLTESAQGGGCSLSVSVPFGQGSYRPL